MEHKQKGKRRKLFKLTSIGHSKQTESFPSSQSLELLGPLHANKLLKVTGLLPSASPNDKQLAGMFVWEWTCRKTSTTCTPFELRSQGFEFLCEIPPVSYPVRAFLPGQGEETKSTAKRTWSYACTQKVGSDVMSLFAL